jgi:hypothetical protein
LSGKAVASPNVAATSRIRGRVKAVTEICGAEGRQYPENLCGFGQIILLDKLCRADLIRSLESAKAR